MKHLILVAALVTSLPLPILAQPAILAQPGGPIQLHNPNRRDGMTPGSGGNIPMGGGSFGFTPGGYSGPAFADPGFGYHPVAPVAPPSVAMFADGPYLYVLRDDTLFQFDKKTLKLVNSTELPRPIVTAPAPQSQQEDIRTHTSPPLRPGPDFKNAPAF